MAAIPGQVLQKLSDKLLGYLGNLGDDLYRRDGNLRELQDHVKRLTPLIAQFLQIRDVSEDQAAREWLQRVSKEYEEVNRLRQPVNGIIQLVQTSGSVREVNKNLSQLLEDAEVMQHNFPSTSQTLEGRWKKGWDTSEPDITCGGQAVVKDVIDALTCGTYPWLVMSGMGGVGKTHLARKAYNDGRVRKCFTGEVTQGMYWVTISKDKPKTYIILQTLCEQILGVKEIPNFPHDLKEAVKEVKGALHQKTSVLIVLDDVWHFDIVKCFDEVLEDDQGVILVTTRDRGNVRCVADVARFIGIPVLSEEESWKLFSWYAFRKRRNDHRELEGVAREVAKECKGLPLALRVIGATMRDIQLLPSELEGGRTLRSGWETILVKLQSAGRYEDKYKELFRKLQLSVDSLLFENSRLFHCFCYFAAYPEDTKIYARELVNLWIAEGLVENGDGIHSFRSQKIDDARLLLDTLVRKSMIERSGAYDPPYYHMHDILRDLAHHNLAWDFLLEKEIPIAKRECLYAPALMSPDFPSEWSTGSNLWGVFKEWILPSTSNALRAKRLSLNRSRVSNLPRNFNAPRLHVLLLTWNESLCALPMGFFGCLSSLTVLDLERTAVEEISAGVLRGLKKLKVLNLSDCKQLRRVSNEVNNLRNLEELHLHGCKKLECLPRVGNLQCFSAPIFKRFNLVFNHGLNGWQRWSDYLSFRGLSRYVILELFHKHSLKLRRLRFKGGESTDDIDSNMLDVSALEALVELYVDFLPPPAGIIKLRNLKSLRLVSVQQNLDYQIPALDDLPLLELLHINLSELTAFPSSFGSASAFPALKHIWLSGNKVRNIFKFCKGTMPKIESVRLHLQKLETFPKSFTNLHTVTEVELWSCSDGVLREFFELVKGRDCLLNLKKLCLFAEDNTPDKSRDKFRYLSLDTLSSLRRFESNCPREQLPLHVVDLEKHRNLQIVYRRHY